MSQVEDHEDSAYNEVLPPALEEFEMKVNPIYGKVSGIVATKKEKTAEGFQQRKAYYRIIMVTLVVTVVLVAVLTLAVAAACIAFALEISNLKTEMTSTQQKYLFNSTHNTASDFATQHLMDQQRLLYEALQSSLEDSLSQLQMNITRDMEQNLAQHLMDKQRLLNEALQFYLEDRLSQLRSNVTRDMELVENSTLQIINMAWEVFEKNLTGLNTELEAVLSELQTLRDIHPGTSKTNPASSCAALLPSSPSGYYWVRTSNGSAVRVYCDMTLECGNITGGWMRVAELDMTNDTQECPIGLEERTNSGLRTCERMDTQAGCSSIEYSTYNIQYSKVCGRVIGYQIGDVNAFGSMPSNDIDSIYVDGVSLTHGSPKRHIWTFGASRDITQNDCPCNRLNTFVEDHYFCDTASDNSGSIGGQFFSNPLWDGSNCIAPHGCCMFNTPPWFYRSLSQSTTDDIEMRLCRDEPCCGENVAIQIVELYVQ